VALHGSNGAVRKARSRADTAVSARLRNAAAAPFRPAPQGFDRSRPRQRPHRKIPPVSACRHHTIIAIWSNLMHVFPTTTLGAEHIAQLYHACRAPRRRAKQPCRPGRRGAQTGENIEARKASPAIASPPARRRARSAPGRGPRTPAGSRCWQRPAGGRNRARSSKYRRSRPGVVDLRGASCGNVRTMRWRMLSAKCAGVSVL